MRLLVCGSRAIEGNEDNLRMFYSKMEEFVITGETLTVITGGARGADTIGDKAAKLMADLGYAVEREVYQADWQTYGRAAGPIRNRKMLESPAEFVLAFIQGESKGTRNCLSQAKKLNIETEVVYL